MSIEDRGFVHRGGGFVHRGGGFVHRGQGFCASEVGVLSDWL